MVGWREDPMNLDGAVLADATKAAILAATAQLNLAPSDDMTPKHKLTVVVSLLASSISAAEATGLTRAEVMELLLNLWDGPK